mmetsp:Transcript_23809/g.52197  ORF Transcript_23809/g.52197 Transcript_23809/m.52197 type:complete len:101 (-) Transcript_23809:1229-1531(-)
MVYLTAHDCSSTGLMSCRVHCTLTPKPFPPATAVVACQLQALLLHMPAAQTKNTCCAMLGMPCAPVHSGAGAASCHHSCCTPSTMHPVQPVHHMNTVLQL